jgi:hypothetical protein
MFESEGHFLAMARALRFPKSRRPPMVVISCWLTSVLPTVGQARLTWYRRMYRTVDGIVVFSTNQLEPLARMLGVGEDVVHYVPFGVDSDWFAPPSVGADDGFVLAVGRDRGRDWPTVLAAARATGLPTKIACRPSDIAGLAVPDNVELLGYVDVESYRSLLQRARVSVVATFDVPYPSGQTVALESMAAAKATVVTRTPSLIDYLDDGINALTVPVGDACTRPGERDQGGLRGCRASRSPGIRRAGSSREILQRTGDVGRSSEGPRAGVESRMNEHVRPAGLRHRQIGAADRRAPPVRPDRLHREARP